jgi:hypothetical protein
MPEASDTFHVIGLTNRHHLKGEPDPVRRFIAIAVGYGDGLVRRGFGIPDIVEIPAEIYSLPFDYKDRFADFGAESDPEPNEDDEYFMSLYFVSDPVVQLAHRLEVELPPTLKEITRAELPEERVFPVRTGQHFWDLAVRR